MTRIAVLGTGQVGTTLATRWAAVGHEVVVGSRRPQAGASVAYREAVEGADVVVSALPGAVVLETLTGLADVLAGAVVLDPAAPIDQDRRLLYPNDSLAARLQAALPGSRVVKTLNLMNVSVMTDPLSTLPSATVMLSGDDPDAKDLVVSLLLNLGWRTEDVLDLGGIGTALATEHAVPLFFALAGRLGTLRFNLDVSR
ncbi:NAD(P)-binding domain-containing protein [Nocardioides sp. GY 10127]|uniref:NADPH-dependent F420 reductase n=1 Tax=Nocardioides sp. GY 10127 TaxID=2569762 RepID=UPI0010A82E4F|nr:NAD(P)-binding domain-containing protein [Nocardioides sp. GY 10127]TIC79123.1 oxidoreductase [Nocardioides sp. GY 10127]